MNPALSLNSLTYKYSNSSKVEGCFDIHSLKSELGSNRIVSKKLQLLGVSPAIWPVGLQSFPVLTCQSSAIKVAPQLNHSLTDLRGLLGSLLCAMEQRHDRTI